MENLEILEMIADTYVKKVSPGKDPAMLVIKYIRTGVDRYNSGSWQIMAGYEDADFAKYVEKYEKEYNLNRAEDEAVLAVSGLKNINNFKLPNGDNADIGHVFGTMDISYTNYINADVAGWASMMALILCSSGLIMLMLGMLGEYIWRALDASRNRPPFIVDEIKGFEK